MILEGEGYLIIPAINSWLYTCQSLLLPISHIDTQWWKLPPCGHKQTEKPDQFLSSWIIHKCLSESTFLILWEHRLSCSWNIQVDDVLIKSTMFPHLLVILDLKPDHPFAAPLVSMQSKQRPNNNHQLHWIPPTQDNQAPPQAPSKWDTPPNKHNTHTKDFQLTSPYLETTYSTPTNTKTLKAWMGKLHGVWWPFLKGIKHWDTYISKPAPVLWLKHFLAKCNPQCRDKICQYMDQGGKLVFNNPEVKNFFTKSGYTLYPTGADASNQNGQVEHNHCSIANIIWTLLIQPGYWVLALCVLSYFLTNQCNPHQIIWPVPNTTCHRHSQWLH